MPTCHSASSRNSPPADATKGSGLEPEEFSICWNSRIPGVLSRGAGKWQLRAVLPQQSLKRRFLFLLNVVESALPLSWVGEKHCQGFRDWGKIEDFQFLLKKEILETTFFAFLIQQTKYPQRHKDWNVKTQRFGKSIKNNPPTTGMCTRDLGFQLGGLGFHTPAQGFVLESAQFPSVLESHLFWNQFPSLIPFGFDWWTPILQPHKNPSRSQQWGWKGGKDRSHHQKCCHGKVHPQRGNFAHGKSILETKNWKLGNRAWLSHGVVELGGKGP